MEECNWGHSLADSSLQLYCTQKGQNCMQFGLFECSRVNIYCSMADGISFDVSLSLNCTDFYKREGGA